MPRTRNVTRAQWDAANATTRDQNQNHDCESEKENVGRMAMRATRSQTRTRSNGDRVALGSTTTTSQRINTTSKGPANTVSTNTSKVKGKGKGKAQATSKRKKLPLQDITSRFLPAPEAANRAEENEAAEHDILQQTDNRVNVMSPLPLAQGLGGGALGITVSTNHPAPTYLDSPLPPSSPPSAITSSPQYQKIMPQPDTPCFGLSYQEEINFCDEFDDSHPLSRASPTAGSPSSDPFGFIALERKLKVERGPSPFKRYHQQAESDEDLGQILVADTSSPRPVRRLKRPLYQGDSTLPPAISEHPRHVAPPPPHKDKKRQRLSHQEDGLSSSSILSTPSPSKPRHTQEVRRKDTLKSDPNCSPEEEGIFGRTRGRIEHGIVKGEPSAIMTPLELASMDNEAGIEEQTDPRCAKAAKAKKISKKPRLIRPKKSKREETVDKNDNNEGYAEKLERERQDRVAYFKRLEGYQVEKEDVYII